MNFRVSLNKLVIKYKISKLLTLDSCELKSTKQVSTESELVSSQLYHPFYWSILLDGL